MSESESTQSSGLAAGARALVLAAQRGVLATLTDDGFPYGSLVEYAPLPDGDVIFLLSRLAEHQRYLTADPRASLLVAPQMMTESALAQGRVTLVGQVEVADDQAAMAEIYLKYHPDARQFVQFADFQFYRLRVQKARYIAGFGRMGWITENRYHSA